MPSFNIRKLLSLVALILTLSVISLGAYTRLVDAGLGCPDWPTCYGLWKAPIYLESLDYMKAHTEMVHRYFASSLGLLIIIITSITLFKKSEPIRPTQKILALGLLTLVIFQGLLGMWTVTLKLLPIVVMGHLVGGLLLASLLFCFWMMQNPIAAEKRIPVSACTKGLAVAALITVSLQIALGGWTSTNYAALSCPDFPLCQNQWWPTMSTQAFNLFGALENPNNPLSYMTLEGRTAIHMMHRIGALCTTIIISLLLFKLWNSNASNTRIKYFIMVIAGLLITQLALGITNVLKLLPLAVALAHNGVATLLLLSIITLLFYLKYTPNHLHTLSKK